jgi:tetratricopeptide (TPR) repeat protein
MKLTKLFPLIIPLLVAVTTANADKGDTFYISARGRFYMESLRAVNQGLEELDKGNTRGALQCFDAAIRIDKNNWGAYYNRAVAYYDTDQLQSSLQDCDTAARLRPDFHRTFIVRAEVYRRLGRCHEALNDLNRIVSFHANPETDALALSRRAVVRATCNDPIIRDPKQALADAKQACRMDPKAIYMVDLAIAYAANGDFESAIRNDQQAINSGRLRDEELHHAKDQLARSQRHERP